ncbi:cobyrinate a,c-diamide synthase [Blastococcus sp. Marseille-P5729]|uniref:cobyrinate a,c-diamide synthase n=1 Tax=Blastococcus sp. Marseille-P5729 TaxID=2086582 RepID=UPI000D10E6E3|nr:cobyrinate a,c-diamide synthase [Blastococcus sp. Marseille-P5729]
MLSIPRVVIAAAASGQGKTTVAVGLMAALTRAGHQVAPAKVGPDYIDPGYHALATGRPGRNLDPWLCRESLILPLLAHGHATPEPAALSMIEGVMGLYDGRLGTDGFASTAHIAALTASPVIVVVDISAAARTVAATVHGLAVFDPAVQVAGVILNKAGSQRHSDEVRRSVERAGYPVLGVLPRDAGVSAPSRHLGLVPAAEREDVTRALDLLAEQTAEYIDLDAVRRIASSADDLAVEAWMPPVRDRSARPIVAVAGGRAFTFRYAETDELLRAQGLEPVVFDPSRDAALPAGAAGLYLGGGFPEMHASDLAGNAPLKKEIRSAVLSGMPTVAECAGMLYLCESVEGHDFVGVIPARAAMHPRLTLQYHRAELGVDSVLGPAGTEVRGHEFHRTRTSPSAGDTPAWRFDADGGRQAEGFALDPAGTGRATIHASYLHTHWAGNPSLVESFSDSVAAFAAASGALGPVAASTVRAHDSVSGSGDWRPAASPRALVDDRGDRGRLEDRGAAVGLGSLDHHGDAELGDGLIDLAVNVRADAPEPWLLQRIAESLDRIAPYPTTAPARRAIARRHGLPDDMVLPTNGAAEAFTLIARAFPARRPVVVHPQFTEPEAALRRAGVTPEQVILHERDGFVLHAAAIPEDADLVVIGNPTNPTGVLHPRGALRSLQRPGRILVVDEAFMDAVPGEPETIIGPDLDGVVVIRSLTKTWSIAGLRAGYVIAPRDLITLLEAQQPHWSVSTPAACAMEATATPVAVAKAAAEAAEIQQWRGALVTGLQRLGLRPVSGRAPFVLVKAGIGVREKLRDRGFAVRTGASFPGLGPEWVRIAVRDPQTTAALLEALVGVVSEEAPA